MKKPGEMRVMLVILADVEPKGLTIMHTVLYVFNDVANGLTVPRMF